MTSDASDDERSIYVGLAHHTGERVQPAGLMKIVRRGVVESGEFAYGRRYLEDPAAAPLNPGHLPLRDAAFVLPERRIREGGAMPLTLRDALPDSWGRKVLEVLPPVALNKGRGVEQLLQGTDITSALYVGDDKTDLDAFAALRRLAADGRLQTAICVGVRSDETPPELEAQADVLVDGPVGVRTLLSALAA